jgi:hypothetical protein
MDLQPAPIVAAGSAVALNRRVGWDHGLTATSVFTLGADQIAIPQPSGMLHGRPALGGGSGWSGGFAFFLYIPSFENLSEMVPRWYK